MIKFRTLLFFLFLIAVASISFAQTVHVVEARDFVFVPENVNVAVGDTIEWQWIEGSHTTTSDSTSGQNVWDAPLNVANQVFRFVITAPGVHHYVCTPHQNLGMVGTITATISGVEDENNPPKKFQLSQNYPNPFNPFTTIKYSLLEPAKVTLKVYNLLGKEVAELVNGNKNAGNYEVEFDASTLPSGIYFYELKAGSFTQTKKMVLLR